MGSDRSFLASTLLPLVVLLSLSACGRSGDKSAHIDLAMDDPIVYEYRDESIADLHGAMAVDSSVIVLDVRTPAEYDGPFGHIDGAMLIPVQQLANRLQELQELQGREIHVVCRSGSRSARATHMLVEAGHNAVNVEGGMRAWRQAYPLPAED